MKTIYAIIFGIFLILLGKTYSFAADCPDYELFSEEINPTKNAWGHLYEIYKRSAPGCDDGAYAEGFSDFVVQSLAKHWNRFDELVSLIQKDPSFQIFVLKHIDATTDLNDLNTISKNVHERCPKTAIQLCKEIDEKANAAFSEACEVENITLKTLSGKYP